VQEIRTELTTSATDLQQQVATLTRTLERTGSPERNAVLTAASQLLARFEGPPETTTEILAANEALAGMLEQLRAAPGALESVPSPADLREQMAAASEELEKLAGAEPTDEATNAERERLARIGESVGREFVQEDVLLNEVTELIDLRATKASLESRIEALKEVLAQR
jgi:hypothetical protein